MSVVPMTKPAQAMIGLPAERRAQVHAIAKKRGVTAVEVIESWIARSIEEGELSYELPGFCAFKTDLKHYYVEIRGVSLPPLDRETMLVLSELVTAAAGGKTMLPETEIKVGRGVRINLSEDVKIYVGRHVNAVLIALQDAKTGDVTFRTATTLSIAKDFGRLLQMHTSVPMMPKTDLESLAA